MEHSDKNHRTEAARRAHFGDAHDMVDHATQPFSEVPTPYWLAAAKRYDLFILENNCNGCATTASTWWRHSSILELCGYGGFDGLCFVVEPGLTLDLRAPVERRVRVAPKPLPPRPFAEDTAMPGGRCPAADGLDSPSRPRSKRSPRARRQLCNFRSTRSGVASKGKGGDWRAFVRVA
jgi:hypothetical protein